MLSNTPKIKSETSCVANALNVIGDKWTLLIIQQMTICPQKFSDLEKNLVGISPRTLSQRLDRLVEEYMVKKSLYCPHPPRFQYSLTIKGDDLKQILAKMAAWSDKYQT